MKSIQQQKNRNSKEEDWAQAPMTTGQKAFLQRLLGVEAVEEKFGGLSKSSASLLIDKALDEPWARRERQRHVRFLFSLAARLVASRWMNKREDLIYSSEAKKAFIAEIHCTYDLLKEAEARLPDSALAEHI